MECPVYYLIDLLVQGPLRPLPEGGRGPGQAKYCQVSWTNIRWIYVRWKNVRWIYVRWKNVRWKNVRWKNALWKIAWLTNVPSINVRWTTLFLIKTESKAFHKSKYSDIDLQFCIEQN